MIRPALMLSKVIAKTQGIKSWTKQNYGPLVSFLFLAGECICALTCASLTLLECHTHIYRVDCLTLAGVSLYMLTSVYHHYNQQAQTYVSWMLFMHCCRGCKAV